MKELERIKKKIAQLPAKKMSQKEQEFIGRYLGTNKKVLGVKIIDIVKIAKDIIKDNLDLNDLIKIIRSLVFSDTFEEHAIGAKIFSLLKPEIRAKISFLELEDWLSKARGWVEIDTICQSTYTGEEVLVRLNDWEKTIKKFSKSDNISLRRASLVLQVKPVGKTNDLKLRQLAFETIEKLKQEKEILITKAVSWLLRALTVQNKEEVREYIIKNELSLPRIAYRETMKKIETGKKNNNKAKTQKE